MPFHLFSLSLIAVSLHHSPPNHLGGVWNLWFAVLGTTRSLLVDSAQIRYTKYVALAFGTDNHRYVIIDSSRKHATHNTGRVLRYMGVLY
jgi:hypothetical protein